MKTTSNFKPIRILCNWELYRKTSGIYLVLSPWGTYSVFKTQLEAERFMLFQFYDWIDKTVFAPML